MVIGAKIPATSHSARLKPKVRFRILLLLSAQILPNSPHRSLQRQRCAPIQQTPINYAKRLLLNGTVATVDARPTPLNTIPVIMNFVPRTSIWRTRNISRCKSAPSAGFVSMDHPCVAHPWQTTKNWTACQSQETTLRAILNARLLAHRPLCRPPRRPVCRLAGQQKPHLSNKRMPLPIGRRARLPISRQACLPNDRQAHLLVSLLVQLTRLPIGVQLHLRASHQICHR